MKRDITKRNLQSPVSIQNASKFYVDNEQSVWNERQLVVCDERQSTHRQDSSSVDGNSLELKEGRSGERN